MSNEHGLNTNDQEELRRSMDELLKLIRFVEHVSTELHSLPNGDVIYRTVCDEFAQTERYSAFVAKVAEDGVALEVIASSRYLNRTTPAEKECASMQCATFATNSEL